LHGEPPVVGGGVPQDVSPGADRDGERGQEPCPRVEPGPRRGAASQRRCQIDDGVMQQGEPQPQHGQTDDDVDGDPPAAVRRLVAHPDRQVHGRVRRSSAHHQCAQRQAEPLEGQHNGRVRRGQGHPVRISRPRVSRTSHRLQFTW
jgi:hypothetical protein